MRKTNFEDRCKERNKYRERDQPKNKDRYQNKNYGKDERDVYYNSPKNIESQPSYIKTFEYNYLGNVENPPTSSLLISKIIRVDTRKYKTISDIHPLIASDLHIKGTQLAIEKPGPDQLLQNLPNNYIIQIKILGFCPNLDFELPNGQIIQIKNGFRLNFYQIIMSLQNEVCSYSPLCVMNNFSFIVNGTKLNETDFPFYSSQPDTRIKIKLQGEIVTIKYGELKLTFSENEPVTEALKLFGKFYKSMNISLLNEQNRIINKRKEVLKSFVHYTLQVDCVFSFNSKSDGRKRLILQLDYLSTVSDAKKQLAIQFDDDKIVRNRNINMMMQQRMNQYWLDISNTHLKPENFVIYDHCMKVINNPNKLLVDIQKETDFYYEIIISKAEKNLKYDDPKLDSDSLGIDKYKKVYSPKADLDLDKFDIDKHKKVYSPKADLDSDKFDIDKHKKVYNPKTYLDSDSDSFDIEKIILKKKGTELKESETPKKEEDKKIDSHIKEEDKKEDKSKKAASPVKRKKIKPVTRQIVDDDDEKLTINFVFEKENKKHIKTFVKNIALNTSIKDVKLMIAKEYDIDDSISIKHKDDDDKRSIDDDAIFIKDIFNDIKNKGSDDVYKNFLYIDIAPKDTEE